MSKRYQKSEALLARALKTIPLGSQTFSKSLTQYPQGVSPFFIEKAQGSKVWDVDGNEYVDFGNSLASITLGYNDPDVNAAVHRQLDCGTIFSLPHPIEIEVAEALTEMIPCAEKVRFGKNGSDATAGAIRLARAATKRDHVAVCGYHGWQDWFIGSTERHLGVPEAVRALTHKFVYNDLDSLRTIFKSHPSGVAAVILEPMNIQEPQAGYLESVKELAHKEGALVIFDETITGFRYANGGAQELFGVTPDLATFGKGVANGYPFSVVAGRSDLMKWMEEIFFSFTFGGETLSLAAAKATLHKLKTQPVLKTLASQGKKVKEGVDRLIRDHELSDFLSISGHPSWTFLQIKDRPSANAWTIKTFMLQELFKRGILMIGTHTMSFAHSDADVEALLRAYGQIFPMIREADKKGDWKQRLEGETLQPLFRLR